MTRHSELPARARVAVARVALATSALIGYASLVEAQAKPAGTIEVGPGAIDDGSFKAGEYNGLEKKGAFGIGNLDLRGGSTGYNRDGTLRWRIKGTDLGLETRNASAQIGQQGKFRLTLGYDELRRNRSDTYQTPFNGTGSNVLTLPGSWLVPTIAGSSGSNNATNIVSARGLVPEIGNAPYVDVATNSPAMGALRTPTAAQQALVNAAAAADVSLFHDFNLFTKRRRFDAGLNYSFDQRWGVEVTFRPEHKDGVKPMGTVSRNTGGDISTIIPDLIDTDHNQVAASVNYHGARSFAQAGYYGSIFKNNVPFMSWQNWATPTKVVNTMSSTPDNTFNQWNLTAGMNFSSTTKLVATGSYGRNTQNDAFLTDATTPVVPVRSLDGLVVTTMFNTRFTTRPAKKLTLAAAYKYHDRDNRTAVNIYQYADAGEAPVANANFPAGPNNPLGPVVAQNANANRPYSRKLNQVTVEADYRFLEGQWIKLGYEFEKIDRACVASWISCADAATTNEHILRADWRATLTEKLTARLGYAYSARRAPDYNENAFLALVPYANVSPAAATGGATALLFMGANGWNGWGPAAGFAVTTGNMNLFFPSNNALANAMYANNNRISELPGMRRYYVADRNRDKLRASLGWQATEKLSFQGGLDLNKDRYPSSTYGVQDAKNWALNADGTYAVGDNTSVDVWYAYESFRSRTAGNSYTANSNVAALTNAQPGAVGLFGNSCDGYTTLQQRNNNNKLDPCLDWSASMLDKAHSVGVGLRKRAGSFDLLGNLILSRARSDTTSAGGNWANNILNGPGGAPTTVAAIFIAAASMPTITTNTGELRLGGRFTINERQSVRLDYSYLRMRSNDPAYEGLQLGSLSGVLPTNEQPFNHAVNIFGASYILTF